MFQLFGPSLFLTLSSVVQHRVACSTTTQPPGGRALSCVCTPLPLLEHEPNMQSSASTVTELSLESVALCCPVQGTTELLQNKTEEFGL